MNSGLSPGTIVLSRPAIAQYCATFFVAFLYEDEAIARIVESDAGAAIVVRSDPLTLALDPRVIPIANPTPEPTAYSHPPGLTRTVFAEGFLVIMGEQ